jgi:UDP-glucose 4-epimerase
MRRVAITGIAGFIGSYLASECLERGWEVRGLDNLRTGRIDNIIEIGEIEFYKGSLADRKLLRKVFKDADVVFHCAGLSLDQLFHADPLTSHAANVGGTLNLLWEAGIGGVRRIVFSGSAGAYGETERLPRAENMFAKAASAYGIQKATSELYMQYFTRFYSVDAVSLRYFNVFGPRQICYSPVTTPIANFIRSMLLDKQPTIYGDGLQSRDFTYISDVVAANMQAALAEPDAVSGKVFNIASGITHTILDAYKAVAQILHYEKQPKYATEPIGYEQHLSADISAARELLGYLPRTGFRVGLEKTIDWYRDGRHFPAAIQFENRPRRSTA